MQQAAIHIAEEMAESIVGIMEQDEALAIEVDEGKIEMVEEQEHPRSYESAALSSRAKDARVLWTVLGGFIIIRFIISTL